MVRLADKTWERLAVAGLTVALLGSTWVAFFSGQCSSCQAAKAMIERDNCKYCQEFESQMLPRLKEEYSELEIERRQAPEGVGTPTILIVGQRHYAFPGLPQWQEITRAMDQAAKADNEA